MVAKSFKRCEIVSRTKDDEGNILFDIENMKKQLKEKKYIKRYAYIFHDKDCDDSGKYKSNHIHLVLEFTNPMPTSNISKVFKISDNFIEKVHSKKIEDCYKYLIHLNAPDKYQYSIDEVYSNFSIIDAINNKDDKEKLDEIIEKILSGSIKEYEKTIAIDIKFYTYHKRIIDEAFKTYNDHRRATDTSRNQTVIFITGDAGAGKTTLAKQICENSNLSYFISSGSNDVLDGYSQQDCIILDDIRPSAMSLSDLLKMTDNHCSSSIKSRYFNKYVNCKFIILTTVLDIDSFYRNVFTEEKESIIQFKRRCQIHIKMTMEYIYVSFWNKKNLYYSNEKIYKNDIVAKYVKEQVEEDIENKVKKYMPFLNKLDEKELELAKKEEPIFRLTKISDEEYDRLMMKDKKN